MSEWATRLAAFAAHDFYRVNGHGGLASTVLQQVRIDRGNRGYLIRAREERAKACSFFVGEVRRLAGEGVNPWSLELVELARRAAQGESLELPRGDGISLLRRAYREQKLRSVLSLRRGDSLPPLGWDRYLPIRDREGTPYPEVRTRLIGTPFLEGREPRGVVALITGLEGVPEKYFLVHQLLARAGLTVFQLELPMVQTNLIQPIPLERRFASSEILARTVVGFFEEVQGIMSLHPELQDKPLAAYAVSQGAYHVLEAIVVLGADLKITGPMYLDAPRIRMGNDYHNWRIKTATVLGALLGHFPRLLGMIHYPKGPPKIDAGMPEDGAAWSLALHQGGVSIEAYHPFLFDLGNREQRLHRALLEEGGHRRLPNQLRVDYCPGDTRVDPEDSARLVALRNADPGRPHSIETIKPRHGGTHDNPAESIPPLVEFLTGYHPTLAELGLET